MKHQERFGLNDLNKWTETCCYILIPSYRAKALRMIPDVPGEFGVFGGGHRVWTWFGPCSEVKV